MRPSILSFATDTGRSVPSDLRDLQRQIKGGHFSDVFLCC